MPRRRAKRLKPTPPPLDPGLVSDFHAAILDGDTEEVDRLLASTRRLGNAKDAEGRTPLMNAVTAETASWQTKIQLVDYLVEKGGASLATRDPDRFQVLLAACRAGVAPEVIDRICYWNAKRGGRDLSWSHCNSDKDGALVLAARSGSATLVTHLLSLTELDINDDSNAPIKIVEAAIQTGDEDLVLHVLRNERLRDDICDIEVYDSYDFEHDDGFGHYESITRSICVEDCISEAYRRKMYRSVCELVSLARLNRLAKLHVWLCWRETLAKLEAQPKSGDSSSPITNEGPEGPIQEFTLIVKQIQWEIIATENPPLLPLLVARARHARDSSSVSVPASDDGLAQTILRLPDPIFQHIAEYCFVFDKIELEKKVQGEVYFQKNAEWCCDCDGWFLPGDCYCGHYGGYSSCSISS